MGKELLSAAANAWFQGFVGLIGKRESFPMLIDNGFLIKPGHKNVVALSVTKVTADETIRDKYYKPNLAVIQLP